MKCPECGGMMIKAMNKAFVLFWVCACGHEEKVR